MRRASRLRSENGAWPLFYRHCQAALAERSALPVDPRDAVAVLEILERAPGYSTVNVTLASTPVSEWSLFARYTSSVCSPAGRSV